MGCGRTQAKDVTAKRAPSVPDCFLRTFQSVSHNAFSIYPIFKTIGLGKLADLEFTAVRSLDGEIVRQKTRSGHKSTVRKTRQVLTRSWASDVEQRLEAIEQRLEASGVGKEAVLPEIVTRKFFAPKVARKPGPSAKIDDKYLAARRDRLVSRLESFWPQIVRKLLSARTEQVIRQALEPISFDGEVYNRLTDNAGELLTFLRSKRFQRMPPKQKALNSLNYELDEERQRKAAQRLPTRLIANAMAGVPELAWRTSFDRCSKMPCRMVVGAATEKYYREIFHIPEPSQDKAATP
jgi:hypothetical protein